MLVLPRVDLTTNVRGERVHGLHSKHMRVTSVSNGYVRNSRQACLVPYQVLSGRARVQFTVYSSSMGNKTKEQFKRVH
jgi:hypothetical protein